MDFGRRMNWIRVALGVVLAIGVAVTAGAQTPPGAAAGELYTPAKDAKDLRAVLFNWMWHMGMLRALTSATWSGRSNIRARARCR